MFIFKRKRKHADGIVREDATYPYKFTFQGEQVLGKTKFTTLRTLARRRAR